MCEDPEEEQLHFSLFCSSLEDIRNVFISKFFHSNGALESIKDNGPLFLISLLDPLSPKLPEDVRQGWSDIDAAYELSRNYFSAIHKQRQKFVESYEKGLDVNVVEERDSRIVISLYNQVQTT